MRIGFDAKRAIQNFTGLGNYSRYLIEILCRFYPENEYLLYAPKRKESRQFNALLENCPSAICRYPEGVWKRFRSLWRTFGVTRQMERDEADIYHGLSNELPLNIRKQKKAKAIVTIHDLIFVRYPQYYHPVDRWLYRYKYGKSCRNADAIIAVSECTKRDAVHYFGIDPSKIHVIYQGCDPSFCSTAPDSLKKEVKELYALPERYILNVGSIEERKNVLLAVKAMPSIPEDVHLVIAGKRTPYTEKVEEFVRANHLSGRVHLLHNVSFRHLPAMYQMAEAFVYPSRFEGFGIPILEALNSSVPVVAATGSCLEEAGGPDSVYVHPDDKEGMASALNQILNNPERKAFMAEQGRKYAENFSEKKQAGQLMELYHSLSSENK